MSNVSQYHGCWCPGTSGYLAIKSCMMTSSYGHIFRVTGPLCGELTGHRWIPLTKASGMGLWCFLWSTPEHTVDREAGDLRCHRLHHDVTVMYLLCKIGSCLFPLTNDLNYLCCSSVQNDMKYKYSLLLFKIIHHVKCSHFLVALRANRYRRPHKPSK